MPIRLQSVRGLVLTTTLTTAFKQYLDGGDAGRRFGRDAPFNRSIDAENAGLMHVHLLREEDWSEHRKKPKPYDRTSDEFIIYARAADDPQRVLIVAVVDPPAHETADIKLPEWAAAAQRWQDQIVVEAKASAEGTPSVDA